MDKALLIAIADYGPLSQKRLDGALEALKTWQRLLTQRYGFKARDPAFPNDPTVNLHTLEGQQATKQAIVRELQWLGVASKNDRLVFMFDGHGTVMNRKDPATGAIYLEQGLVTYPQPSDTLATVTLFGDEVVGALGATLGRVLCVIDACHAEGVFDGTGPLQLQSLFVDARAFGFERSARFRLSTFVGRLVQPALEASIPSIVVAAATQTEQAAYEGTIGGVRRMLFSYTAADLLDQHPEHSYNSLYALLVPQVRSYQIPILEGDSTRRRNIFTY